MSLRWRRNGDLLCGAKTLPDEGDTYIDDRLHYKLSVELKVVIPNEDEWRTGIWRWIDEVFPVNIKK
ncbi:hypothetical protein LCGC14_1208690 [marine sediment metagenome]|uniref:Uncharacterized protein n=1 Tax=marine sediment metagenome TaxID=412755 RepID=A0A0F9PJF1_9ZZZZ